MNTKILKQMFSKAVRFATRNKAVILIGCGVGGMWGTVIESSHAAPVAKERLAKRKKELGVEKLPIGETIKTAGPVYIPTIALGLASTGCIIGGTCSTIRRQAALAAACSLSENALSDYKSAVAETVGAKKEKLIDETMAKKKINNLPPANDIPITPGDVRCVDTFTGLEFYSNYGKIMSTISEINYDIATSDTYMSLNEIQQRLGIKSTEAGDILGYSVTDGKLEVRIDHDMSTDNVPCLAMTIQPYPRQDYWRR